MLVGFLVGSVLVVFMGFGVRYSAAWAVRLKALGLYDCIRMLVSPSTELMSEIVSCRPSVNIQHREQYSRLDDLQTTFARRSQAVMFDFSGNTTAQDQLLTQFPYPFSTALIVSLASD